MTSSPFEQMIPQQQRVLPTWSDQNAYVQDLTGQERRSARVFSMLVESRNRAMGAQNIFEQTSASRQLTRVTLSQASALGQTAQSPVPEASGVEALAGEMLRYLVTHRMLDAARMFLERRPIDPGSELAGWKRALAEPKAQPADDCGADSSDDYDWLARHGHDYIGSWVALLRGQLVAHAPRLDALLRELDSRSLRTQALIHKIT